MTLSEFEGYFCGTVTNASRGPSASAELLVTFQYHNANSNPITLTYDFQLLTCSKHGHGEHWTDSIRIYRPTPKVISFESYCPEHPSAMHTHKRSTLHPLAALLC